LTHEEIGSSKHDTFYV